jgi:arginine repressor
LDLETVSTIVHGQTYHDRYLETYWSQSSPLEKAVSIVIAEHQPMTLKQIHSKLRDQGFQATIEQIRKAIRYLSLCQILVSNGEEYSINLVKFKELLSVFTYTTWMDDLCQEWTQVSKEKP